AADWHHHGDVLVDFHREHAAGELELRRAELAVAVSAEKARAGSSQRLAAPLGWRRTRRCAATSPMLRGFFKQRCSPRGDCCVCPAAFGFPVPPAAARLRLQCWKRFSPCGALGLERFRHVVRWCWRAVGDPANPSLTEKKASQHWRRSLAAAGESTKP